PAGIVVRNRCGSNDAAGPSPGPRRRPPEAACPGSFLLELVAGAVVRPVGVILEDGHFLADEPALLQPQGQVAVRELVVPGGEAVLVHRLLLVGIALALVVAEEEEGGLAQV